MAGLLLTGAWYRWRDRRTGSQTPLRGYLVTGLVLTGIFVLAAIFAPLIAPYGYGQLRGGTKLVVMAT